MEPEQATPEVTTAELRQLLADGSAYVFDARPYLAYAISHIPGSLTATPRAGVGMSPAGADVAEIERIVQDKTASLVLYGNGPFCDRCQWLAAALLAAGFTNVRCYQLGIPIWRALVGLTQIEPAGIDYLFDRDKTACWVDSRSPAEFAAGSLPGAVNLIDKEAVTKAKADQRLPVQDHNTRIIVFGKDGEQVQRIALAIVKNAFHNVSYFSGTMEQIR
ncbi:MAG: sulfur transferase [Caldilinea sp. CFX5]|nr:sulfur transferase [Caldilinea sp. CFX5]